MPISAAVADTPYVLMDENRRIGPDVLQVHVEIPCSSIYGFSDKRTFGKFCKNSQPALNPYPPVKGYLCEQVCAPGDCLSLVAVDVAGPREPYLHAATMEAGDWHENH